MPSVAVFTRVTTPVTKSRTKTPGGGWFTTKKYAGAGALMDIGVHWVDTSMFLAGSGNGVAPGAAAVSVLGVIRGPAGRSGC